MLCCTLENERERERGAGAQTTTRQCSVHTHHQPLKADAKERRVLLLADELVVEDLGRAEDDEATAVLRGCAAAAQRRGVAAARVERGSGHLGSCRRRRRRRGGRRRRDATAVPEGADGTLQWERDWTARHRRHCGALDVERRAIRVDKREAAVLFRHRGWRRTERRAVAKAAEACGRRLQPLRLEAASSGSTRRLRLRPAPPPLLRALREPPRCVGHLDVHDAVRNVALFWVEVSRHENSAHDGVVVHLDAVLEQQQVQVLSHRRVLLRLRAFAREE